MGVLGVCWKETQRVQGGGAMSIPPIRRSTIDTSMARKGSAPVCEDRCPIKHWYVIYTKPRAEEVAEEELEKKAISVFLPRIRQIRFRKHRLREHIEPLFPNYIFARFTIPDDYYDVIWTKGVKRIVGGGVMPVPLDDSVVIFLKQQSDERDLIQPKRNLKTGDRVRVKQGPLRGLWGVVRGEINAKGRIRILMDILRSGTRVELPYSYVERYG
jgi:transcriptional antiterminator RfaH